MSGRWLLAVALACLAAPLGSFAMVGWFSRYAADDYCTAGQVTVIGFVDAQSRLYVDWSGRFGGTLLVTLVELIGPAAVPLLPIVALAAWLLAATWAICRLAGALGRRIRLLAACVVATLVVYVTLQTTADMPQVLYWQTGMLTYLSPLVLATLYVGWLARCARRGTTAKGWAFRLAICFVLAFLAGGTSETFAAAQEAALVLALILACLAGAGPVRPMLLLGLIGATLAAAIVASAPGNEVRQSSALRTPLLVALPQAVDFMRGWLRLTFARPHAIDLLLLIGIPALVAATSTQPTSSSRRTPWYALAYGAVGMLLVIAACILPAYYALGTNPPGRAQLIPEYVLVCSLAVLGWVVGTSSARHIARASGSAIARWSAAGALLVLLGVGPVSAAGQALLRVAADRAYAAAWDQIDAEIRAERGQGIQDVTVPPLASTGNVQNLQFIGNDRGDWFNACVARYYRVNTIAAET